MHTLGAKIIGYAIDPISKPNFFDDMKLSRFLQKDYRKNINDIKYLKKVIKINKPEIIFHMAAQSFIILSFVQSPPPIQLPDLTVDILQDSLPKKDF